MNGMANEQLYSRERVTSVIARVRRTGGLPIPARPLDQYQSWFRTLAKRGYVEPDFLRNGDRVRQQFRRDFPNSMTRAQYVRGFLMYLTGLDDAEFAAEFHDLDREGIVRRLQAVSTEANKERRTKEPATDAGAFDTI